MNKFHIVITDFNGYAQTQRCLSALRASYYQEFTVLVVDHGTTDETRAGLIAEFPEVIRLVGSSELWWAGANNLGIRFAIEHHAEAIMLLNNDCYVMPDAITILAESITKYPEAIIAAVQRDSQSGRLTSISPRSCFLLGFPNLLGPTELTLKMTRQKVHPVRLIVGGRGVVIPAGVFTQIGLFDEIQLPHYGADHDFYLRAAKRGIELYVASKALVEIDNARTTLADNPGGLDFSEFLESLRNIRSHRNLRDITVLFKEHYPIPYLYPLGVALYFIRYFLVYLVGRYFK